VNTCENAIFASKVQTHIARNTTRITRFRINIAYSKLDNFVSKKEDDKGFTIVTVEYLDAPLVLTPFAF